MEAPKGKRIFPCKLCEKSYLSGPALGGHMRLHYTGILNRNTKSAYGNEEPEDLTPESELKDVALALINMNGKLSSGEMKLQKIDVPKSGAKEAEPKTLSLEMQPKDLTPESKLEYEVAIALIDLKLGSRKSELLEIDIPEAGAEEAARKSPSVEMWPKDREKIQGTDPALEEKEKIEQVAKPVSKLEFVRKRKRTQTDVSNLTSDLKRTVYECNICHRTFRSHQALGGHLSRRMGGRTCLQEDIQSMPFVARFNCDGYILKTEPKEREMTEPLQEDIQSMPFVALGGHLLRASKEKEMTEAPKGKKKFPCKLCEKSYLSGPALGGHMRLHYTGILNRNTKSACGNEEPKDLTLESEVKDVALALINMNGKLSSGEMELQEIDILKSGAEEAACKTLSLEMRPKDLTPKSKLEDEVALALIDLKSGSRKSELLEIYIPESGAEEATARKSLSVEMWPKDREKIQGTDPALEEKEKIEQEAKPVSKLEFVRKRKRTQTDVSKGAVYECNICHRTFRSHQALGGHLSGRMGGRTCLQEDIQSMPVVARFNCDGYILKTDVVWAKRR